MTTTSIVLLGIALLWIWAFIDDCP